jgi:phage/plasmid-associated DNA primase
MILCNDIPKFDKVDAALLDRLYIIRCPGRFRPDADPDPAVQRQQHVYPIDHEFWNEQRIRALLHVARTEGYHFYAKDGLQKTPAQMKELKEWNMSNDEYACFAEVIQETYHNVKYYTEATSVYNFFKLKHPRSSVHLSYEGFKKAFYESTGYKTIVIDETQYYQFYHPDCNRRCTSNDLNTN